MNLIKFFILITFFANSIYGMEKVKIFMLHSYSQEYVWTKNQHSSFVSTLSKNNIDFEIYSEYLDTKRLNFTLEYKRQFLEYLKTKYRDANPDLIYVSDDNALSFVYEYYEKLFKNYTNSIPVFFSGINDFNMSKKLPSSIFTGVYELKEIEPNIELIKQFSPQTRDVYIIGDNSNTYDLIKKEIQAKENNFTNFKFHYISDSKISSVKKELPDKYKNFVILTTIGNFKDDKGNTLLPKESIQRLKQNSNLIILSMEDAYMHSGVVGGYVTSGIRQGEEAAKLVLRYLKTERIKEITPILKSPNLYIFNSKELINSRVVLSEYIARNSTIIGKDRDFIEKNQSILLNILAITTAIMLFVVAVLYIIWKKRHLHLFSRLGELDNITLELSVKNKFIENIFNFGDIAYWKLDTKSDKFFCSKELLNILGLKFNIYKDDSNFLYYFMNTKELKIFDENLSSVKIDKKTIKFKHEIITSENAVLNVEHIVYIEKHSFDSDTITGIIKIDK